jgi:hypothetical protein
MMKLFFIGWGKGVKIYSLIQSICLQIKFSEDGQILKMR